MTAQRAAKSPTSILCSNSWAGTGQQRKVVIGAMEGGTKRGSVILTERIEKEDARSATLPDGSRRLCLIAGNSSKQLGQAIAAHLGMPLSECELSRFADGEAKIQVPIIPFVSSRHIHKIPNPIYTRQPQ